MRGREVAVATSAALALAVAIGYAAHESPDEEVLVQDYAQGLGKDVLRALASDSLQPDATVLVAPSAGGLSHIVDGQPVEIRNDKNASTTVWIETTYPSEQVKDFKDKYRVFVTVDEPTSRVIDHPASVPARAISQVIIESLECKTREACESENPTAGISKSNYYERAGEGWGNWEEVAQPADDKKVMGSILRRYGW